MSRILSIEDDEDVQHLIGQVLFQAGHELHYAWNGKEGHEKILQLRPELVLLDLMMPLMNGVELLEKLKGEPAAKDMPVIIVSSYGDKADLLSHSVKALGAAEYLSKPVDPKTLVHSVEQVLARFPRPQELAKGAIRADIRLRNVWIEGYLIATPPPKEFLLLRLLMESPGPVPKGTLLRALGYEDANNNALKQTIHRLREDLGPAENHRIRTTPEGYELLG